MASNNKDSQIHTLSTGVRVRVTAVNMATLTDIQKNIVNPEVPTRLGDNMELVPMLDHPDYLAGVAQKDMERASAMMDEIALFNVELVDGLPEDDSWLKKLQMLHRIGRLDLSGFDFDDKDDREFLYKKHIAVTAEDWTTLFKLSRVPQEITAQVESTTTESE